MLQKAHMNRFELAVDFDVVELTELRRLSDGHQLAATLLLNSG